MKRGMLVVALSLVASPLHAQSLSEKISQLFVFSPGQEPGFLTGSFENPDASIAAHGKHFLPSVEGNNATLIQFLTNAVGTNISNIPISATSGGVTYRFEGGVPVPTSTSPGPIIGERAQTLGRGRLLVGANVTRLTFKSIRGVRMDNIGLKFVHENVQGANCDAIFGDCSPRGVPALENDFIDLNINLDLNVTATTFVLSYGLLDRVDIGAVVPIISTNLRGSSAAEIVPFGDRGGNPSSVVHYFSGTPEDPVLQATTSIDGSASGIGDIAARLKIAVSESENARFSILGEARFPTGSEEDLLGAGETTIRGLGVISAEFGNFAGHGNLGYSYHDGDDTNDAVLATVGFDQLLAPWATLAVDLVSELQVGESKLTLPEDVTIEVPFHRTITPTTFPDMRDDIVNAALGFKFTTPSGLTIIMNSIWPLNDGGMRPDVVLTGGVEYSF